MSNENVVQKWPKKKWTKKICKDAWKLGGENSIPAALLQGAGSSIRMHKNEGEKKIYKGCLKNGKTIFDHRKQLPKVLLQEKWVLKKRPIIGGK